MSKDVELAEVHAGFPSPAEDFMNVALDLNKELVRNPSSTFFARVKGVSMIDDGVGDGDMLIIDKSAEPWDGCLAVCFVDGEFTLKRYRNKGDYALLMPANKAFKPIRVDADNQFAVWGVVKYLIKKM
ncbi:MAG: translesion error-prone DNA polymerase V autoproteolytic subunit [Bacteroidales bacterium]|nr:translesion error-prone DNA polymerase V autoproteolytic subunit [Bacteroidales bacterium]